VSGLLRIVLAEDSVLLREGLIRLLQEAGHTVVAAVDNALELVPAVIEHRPDVAVVDVRMPPTFTDDGLHAAVAARRVQPGLSVLVLSQYVEEPYARDLLADGGGGVGYLLKDRIQDLDALDRVAGGGSAIDPEVVGQLLARRRTAVLALMAEGRSNAGIAHQIGVSDGAVEKHIRSVLMKLDLPPSEEDHRRVLAVLAWLRGTS
jgi:DNA-binding NarL/FixJ family response regulator